MPRQYSPNWTDKTHSSARRAAGLAVLRGCPTVPGPSSPPRDKGVKAERGRSSSVAINYPVSVLCRCSEYPQRR
jgi:hypothetical protein